MRKSDERLARGVKKRIEKGKEEKIKRSSLPLSFSTNRPTDRQTDRWIPRGAKGNARNEEDATDDDDAKRKETGEDRPKGEREGEEGEENPAVNHLAFARPYRTDGRTFVRTRTDMRGNV